MPDLILRTIAAGSTIFIGLVFFIHVVNRQLRFADIGRGQIHKPLKSFVVIVGSSILLAVLLLSFTGWWVRYYLWVIGFLFGIILFGEVRLFYQRLKHRGDNLINRISLEFNGKEFKQANQKRLWRKLITTTDLQILEYEVEKPIPIQKHSFNGSVRVVSLSDFHLHPNMPFRYYEAVIEKVNQLNPDLVFLVGDFVTDLEHSQGLDHLLRGIRSIHGTFASLGNHDYWAGADIVLEIIGRANIQMASNHTVKFLLESEGTQIPIVISGCDDPWGKPLWSPPIFDVGSLNLVLSHTPDNIYRLTQYPITAVFSGHYHGGQFRAPGFGSIVLPSGYGRRFDQGHFVFRGLSDGQPIHLFVSKGVGVANPAVRFYCQPDIIVVNFKIIPKIN